MHTATTLFGQVLEPTGMLEKVGVTGTDCNHFMPGIASEYSGGGSAATVRMGAGAGTTSMISTHGRGMMGIGTLHARRCVCMYE
jgi:hypothetical protein